MLQDFNLTQKRAELMKKMIFILLFISLTCSVCETSEVRSAKSFHYFKNVDMGLRWEITNRSLDSFHIYCFVTTDHNNVSVLLEYDKGLEIPHDGPFKGRVRLDRDALSEGTVRFHVSSLRIEDSGYWNCEVNKSEGFKLSPAYINVTELPTTPETTAEVQTTPETTAEVQTTPETTLDPHITPETTTEPQTTRETTKELQITPETTTEPQTIRETTTEPQTIRETTTEPHTTPETTTELPTTPETKAETEPEPVERSTERGVWIGLVFGLSALGLCVCGFISICFYKRKRKSRAVTRDNSADRNTNAAGHEDICLNQVDGTCQI